LYEYPNLSNVLSKLDVIFCDKSAYLSTVFEGGSKLISNALTGKAPFLFLALAAFTKSVTTLL